MSSFVLGSSGGYRIIELAQDGAFWIGLIMIIYGLVEAMMGYPDWKKRLFTVTMCYIAILVAPIVFMEIKMNLQPEMRRQFIEARERAEERVQDTDNVEAVIDDLSRNSDLSREEVRKIVEEVLKNER